MSRIDIRCVLPARALNGERPGWDAGRARLFWVDIRAPALHAFDPRSGEDRHWEMPAWIGCYAITDTGALVALRTGLFHLDLDSGALDLRAAPPFDSRRFIFNEGDCDRQGRFWAGPMYVPLAPGDQDAERPKALPFWRYVPGGASGPWLPGTLPVQTANSLTWSPDGRRMYHSDTEQQRIFVSDYDVTLGEAANPRVFAAVEQAGGGPDGVSVDRDGFLWCAVFGGGRLLRFDPAGRVERAIPMPVQYPTMPAFGGADLGTIFVTSARWPLTPEEREHRTAEGNLFAFEAPVPGLPLTRFRADRAR